MDIGFSLQSKIVDFKHQQRLLEENSKTRPTAAASGVEQCTRSTTATEARPQGGSTLLGRTTTPFTVEEESACREAASAPEGFQENACPERAEAPLFKEEEDAASVSSRSKKMPAQRRQVHASARPHENIPAVGGKIHIYPHMSKKTPAPMPRGGGCYCNYREDCDPRGREGFRSTRRDLRWRRPCVG